MKRVFILGLIAIITACSSKKEGNMVVQGTIKGLQKGTLYLQKMNDSVLFNVDSISLYGKEIFKMSDDVSSPEMYFLTFDGNTTEKRIMFFGEQGIITINDDVEKFGVNPTIEGSDNQKIMNDYFKITKRFQEQYLDLIEQDLTAQKDKNISKISEIKKKSDNLTKRRYLFATNYAINNGDYEASPYIALTDLVDANIKLLDTIHVSLSPKIKESLYGKKLTKFIAEIKDSEKED
ncbi:DUF4369 domain-containing protein [Flavobacteriaceae bacterium S356]|uniref:DUF4369 domain-containing protein n=1 Tax=Asprobacillus argus TaxID=3076534 RepID=A0ABU3LGU2_9FLAO|nr:DUF4369 domain-containing protein [Flavobacteriaceae bacterium S356]